MKRFARTTLGVAAVASLLGLATGAGPASAYGASDPPASIGPGGCVAIGAGAHGSTDVKCTFTGLPGGAGTSWSWNTTDAFAYNPSSQATPGGSSSIKFAVWACTPGDNVTIYVAPSPGNYAGNSATINLC